jgi:ARP2/3 complex 16 kDa subunit (p16-Arc)
MNRQVISGATTCRKVLKVKLLRSITRRLMDTNFRKIDIDLYDEDVLVETELYDADPRDPSQVLSDTKQKSTLVRSALAKFVS